MNGLRIFVRSDNRRRLWEGRRISWVGNSTAGTGVTTIGELDWEGSALGEQRSEQPLGFQWQ
jgi:hypothetical protein